MRVLKQGSENPKLFKIEESCTGQGWDQYGRTPCGALLEVSGRDFFKRSHTDYGGYTDTYYGFVCPICGCFTEVDASKLPTYVKNNALIFRFDGLDIK